MTLSVWITCLLVVRIKGMVRMTNCREGFTGPVNIGNPGEFTMLQLAQQELNWSPIVNLEKGLEKTIEYFKTII